MSTKALQTLEAAPRNVVRQGLPATGRYVGSPFRIDWSLLGGQFQRSALWRRLHHKRWHYVGIATEQCFIGLAIIDLGWTNTAFAYLFDRQKKKLLVDYAKEGLPGLTARVTQRAPTRASTRAPTLSSSWFRHLGASMGFSHRQGTSYRAFADVGKTLQIDAQLNARLSAPFLTAIGPIPDGGSAHCTVKSSALEVHGSASAGGTRFDLTGGVASFDYSNGLLARNTQWRWACAHSPTVGFNLQQGYFGSYENVLWLDGVLIPLGQAQFDFDPVEPLKPWHIHTDDGLLDLWFEPEGARQSRKNMIVAASYYIQPVGTFSGTVKASPKSRARQVHSLVGVTEDHQSRW